MRETTTVQLRNDSLVSGRLRFVCVSGHMRLLCSESHGQVRMSGDGDLFPSTVRHMTDNRKSGLALIAGSVGGIVTMAIHPTSAGVLTPAQFERLATVSAIAHSLAIVSFVIMLLGAIGLSMRLTASDRLAFSGHDSFCGRRICNPYRCVCEWLYRPEHHEADDQRRSCSRPAMAYRGCSYFSNQPGVRLDLQRRCCSCNRALVNLRVAKWRHASRHRNIRMRYRAGASFSQSVVATFV